MTFQEALEAGEIKRLYEVEGWSSRKVGKEYGVGPDTVLRWLKRSGVTARPPGDTRTGKTFRIKCLSCGKTTDIYRRPWELKQKKPPKFCNLGCRNDHRTKNKKHKERTGVSLRHSIPPIVEWNHDFSPCRKDCPHGHASGCHLECAMCGLRAAYLRRIDGLPAIGEQSGGVPASGTVLPRGVNRRAGRWG